MNKPCWLIVCVATEEPRYYPADTLSLCGARMHIRSIEQGRMSDEVADAMDAGFCTAQALADQVMTETPSVPAGDCPSTYTTEGTTYPCQLGKGHQPEHRFESDDPECVAVWTDEGSDQPPPPRLKCPHCDAWGVHHCEADGGVLRHGMMSRPDAADIEAARLLLADRLGDVPLQAKIELWRAVHQYVQACGGDPKRMGDLTTRGQAVAEVERAAVAMTQGPQALEPQSAMIREVELHVGDLETCGCEHGWIKGACPMCDNEGEKTDD